METINDRIKKVVDDSRLTKTEFAKKINISQPTVSMFCSGKANPSDRTIADICREFRVNETWLRTGEGKMRIDSSQRDQLEHFFADVLTTAPDKRSAFIASLDALPAEFWDMVADWAEAYVANLVEQKKED
ncbi:MAG: helix-turn-helix transcriptional regulator [Firmicutes bacterium]|nr:helix-turn-helix transcriptional regulator [Bacillota bacterium]